MFTGAIKSMKKIKRTLMYLHMHMFIYFTWSFISTANVWFSLEIFCYITETLQKSTPLKYDLRSFCGLNAMS